MLHNLSMQKLRSQEYLLSLVNELRGFPEELEWLEFKHNNEDPSEIGEYISALSNSAAYCGKAFAYLIWGISNADHSIVGTTFRPASSKKGAEELESWLLRMTSPKINFSFSTVEILGRTVVVLTIERAQNTPVSFSGSEFIRIGSNKKKLKDFSERERTLWRIFDTTPFEVGIASERQTTAQVLSSLDYKSYFDLSGLVVPEQNEGIAKALEGDNLIVPCDAGGWNITNLGAILFATRLEDYPSLARKAMRVISYAGNDRVETTREQIGLRGYASGFKGLISYVNSLIPSNEIIGQALRRKVPMFPELAVRELIANALIHQDFSLHGTGPMVEIFSKRIEITNPGSPLIDTNRFVDTPPRSRNETLASLLRRLGVCEERGSGWDKVVWETENYQLPAPTAESTDHHTRVVLYAHKALSEMDKGDRIHACYLHACLKHVSRDQLTNSSLRARFGVEERNKAAVSRYIKEAVDADLIKPYEVGAARNQMRYVPFWA
ncbi:ATP-binding protein [Xylophilus sp. Leaf220]|uniref:ATP-binding protein n=1 Tax=Xylophilus sp. Leaf220 TaxID=1735686 RepID=UPI001F1CF369|nr:ATP-binding protein [Xylophilus sp. Leaf220]